MGITGLLPLLKSIMVPFHIKDLRGCSVAVDTYSWLHKGALSCSKELCKGIPTSRHIAYCMHRVNLLRHHGVKPILVFDGGFLPMKSEQEAKRSRARKENLERAVEHESMGNSAAAYECYQKAVDISPSVAKELIQVLKQEKVDYVVAPYEADAQMTFLAVSKLVDAVITEDSDLIPFGCPRIIFKMDKFGLAVQFQYSMLQQNKELNFTGFTKQMVLEMCILSGCDYLQSLPGMGLKKAHALICKFKSYEKVIKHLRYNIASVPPLYEESFKKALWTFQHQRVYDPITEDIVHLSEIDHDLGEDLEFLGPMLQKDIAKDIARGDIDPITKMPFQGMIVLDEHALDRSYKPKELRSERERKKPELPAQKNVLTNYFCSASVEAKRKFKVPRTMSKNLGSTEESSPSSEENACEDSTFTMNCSPSNFSGSSTPLEDSFASDTSQSLESPCYTELSNMDDGSGDPGSSQPSLLSTQPKHALYKPCITLHKERKSKLILEQVAEKTRSVSRKVIVRSSYFQHKLLRENDVQNENEKVNTENDAANDVLFDKSVSESPSYGSNSIKGGVKKKASSSVERSQAEFVEVKRARQSESLGCKRNNVLDPDTKSVEMGSDEGKFGCNISHLSHFSDVAEKSMERFISVISSFKCSSSGSRASGLRAPLKDVRNTLATRSTISPMDLGEFSYAPKNQKISSVPSKRKV